MCLIATDIVCRRCDRGDVQGPLHCVPQAWSESKQQWEYLYFFTEVEFTLNDYRYVP